MTTNHKKIKRKDSQGGLEPRSSVDGPDALYTARPSRLTNTLQREGLLFLCTRRTPRQNNRLTSTVSSTRLNRVAL